MVNPAHPFGALPDSLPAAETTDKYRICQVSDDYKYMYAWGRNQQGVQSIVRTEDFGQNWIEITDPAIYNSNFDTYPTLMTASRNGKVICVPYKDRPRTASDSSYYGIAISRDYGVTWEKVADLFYFFMQNSTRPISSVGIPDNDKYGFDQSQFPIATQISDGIIAFPVGPHLDTEDMQIIATELKQCMDKIK